MAKSKKPNNKNNLFYDENSFNLDISYARHYFESDKNDIVTLYRVNVVKTKTHKLYGESEGSDKKFFPPVDLFIVGNLAESIQSNMSDTGIVREDNQEFTFSVFIQELEEKNCDIKRGDYVLYNDGANERYYEVTFANNIQGTAQMIGGYAPHYKNIKATPVKGDVIINLS